ncbi:Pre-mRNA-processing ATP-dependent RNA helicase prp5 [Golovinomyces cichoracearum]|uniref:RNA helicase n=1 Tax=Golovinomyces cichoracearum TaxID=62708 RepID=A0A420J8L1_9PEZI|nr:Pre-mRNA-processing ATP-dependent RNA helicase prp5 [Golovinomyces cichoracearum]
MARHKHSRSPSPAGSQLSSKKIRREEDTQRGRDRRDDGSGGQRWSRSRSVERRYRDRDLHRRRERTIERRDEPYRRSDRRDRSRNRRERYTDRDKSPDRRRRRSRDRDRDREYRDRRNDPIDRTRRRHDDSTDSISHGRGDSTTEKLTRKSVGTPSSDLVAKNDVGSGPSEAEKKAERLAKLDAWKKKIAEDKKRAERDLAANKSPSITSEPNIKPINSSAETVQDSTNNDGVPSPAPYAGKFDPKAIAKKAVASSNCNNTLGEDLPVPDLIKASNIVASSAKGVPAEKKPVAFNDTSKVSALPKARRNLSAFGLGARTALDNEKAPLKRAIDLGEDESARKKLEKLPVEIIHNQNTSNVDEDEMEDDDIGMEVAGTEEETAAVARAAAEKRDERIHEQTLATPETEILNPEKSTSGEASDSSSIHKPVLKPIAVTQHHDNHSIDPLDAFMEQLGDPLAPPTERASFIKTKNKIKQQDPQPLFGDDDVGLNTMEPDPDDILAMANKVRKKKDLPTVNYANLDLEPFRKNFYTEPAELVDMTESELADLRMELDGIKVSGKDVPKPVQKWSHCGLNIQSLEVIRKLGYEKPTAIQMQAIPAIMSGRDVIGVAKTGSGKTMAFMLPMFRHIRDQRPLEGSDGPIGLIMTPTRELATQIHKECRPFLKVMGLRAVCAYGGAPIKDQIADLKRGAEIIVCTPGRMIDLLAANSGRVTNLRRVTYVVLDEADRMFDMGFEPQVMKIFANIRPNRQTILFSATMPRIMDALAKKTLQSPVEITVGGRSVVAPEITQIVEVREENEKFRRLLELLGQLYDKDDDARTLIFVDRQEKSDDLLKDLMRKGYPCMSIHGGKDQIDRDSTIDDFKAGVIPIMIATSVAARGLDVKQLKLVVNFDAPNHLEDYVHRAGRTGRAGNTGTAVTFITEDQEQYSVGIAKALEQSGQPVPERLDSMRKSFRDKVKTGKYKDSSGFGGKGLERLDAEREAARNRERKTHKTDADDDEEKEEKVGDDEIVNKVASSIQAVSAAAPSPQLFGVPKGIDLDGKITVHRTEPASSSAAGSKNPLDKVTSAIDAINARLNKTGQLRSGVPIDNKGPDAGAFHATLEINDFPQKARWAVTNRTNVAKILEATGTSITTKGSFYPAGKEVQAGGDPKLYILVEGDTELVVTNAMKELMRLLKEGTMAAADAEGRAPASGRYTVT